MLHDGNQQEVLRTLLQHIPNPSAEKRIVIGIDGPCACGKSSLAQSLSQSLKAPVIHMDDFFLPSIRQTKERFETPGENIDHERFSEEVLLNLPAHRPFSYRIWSCKSQSFQSVQSVLDSDYIVVEGTYAFHHSLYPIFDYRILGSVDPDTQKKRLQQRNPSRFNAFLNRWIPLETAYFASADWIRPDYIF